MPPNNIGIFNSSVRGLDSRNKLKDSLNDAVLNLMEQDARRVHMRPCLSGPCQEKVDRFSVGMEVINTVTGRTHTIRAIVHKGLKLVGQGGVFSPKAFQII